MHCGPLAATSLGRLHHSSIPTHIPTPLPHREFAGYAKDAPEATVHAIMDRAQEFLPGLSGVDRASISVRTGPRPYATVRLCRGGSVLWSARLLRCAWAPAVLFCRCRCTHAAAAVDS